MELKLKTKARKKYERATRLSKWHKKFAWLPVCVDEEQGVSCYVWLKPVMRKCKLEHSDDKFAYTPIYKKCEDLTQAILAGENEQAIIFLSYNARSVYRGLKDELKIKDEE